MGLTHIFTFVGDMPSVDKNNKLNWCPTSCTLATLMRKIKQKIAGAQYKNTPITKAITEDIELLIDIICTVHNRVAKRLIVICLALSLSVSGIIESLPNGLQWAIVILLICTLSIAVLLTIINYWLNYKYVFDYIFKDGGGVQPMKIKHPHTTLRMKIHYTATDIQKDSPTQPGESNIFKEGKAYGQL